MLVFLQIGKERIFYANSVKMPTYFYSLNKNLNCFIITFLLAVTVTAQQVKPDNSSSNLIEITREFYGTDDILVNGQKYIPGHFLADGNPYFQDKTWTKGTVTVEGKLFENVDLLYNAEVDQLILQTKISSGDTVFVVLNSEKVDSFSLAGRKFIGAAKLTGNQQLSGYYEEAYRGSFIFLIKHQKTFIADYSKTSPKGHFSKLNSTNYIYKNGQFYKVTNTKALLTYFSTYSKSIKGFMKKNKINYSKADNTAMKLLLNYCDDLSSGKI